jgi:peptide chain release factor 1
MDVPEESSIQLNERDLEWKATRGSGAGGQHRNKTSSAIQLTHLPSKTTVRVENERSQHQNLRMAKALLAARLESQRLNALETTRNAARKSQVGGGARGDKRRTTALQRDQVTDHILDRKMNAAKYMKGELEDLVG